MALDIIIPIFNQEKNILNIYNKLKDELANVKHYFIFVNDSSNDKSLETLKNIQKKDESNVKIINFSKKFGKEEAIYAGLIYSKHDLVCIYDLDLQINANYITKMYNYLQEHSEYDQICMYSNNKIDFKIKLYNKLFKSNIDNNKTYFRLIKRNVVNGIIKYCENNSLSINTFNLIGFNTYYLKFESKNIVNLNDYFKKNMQHLLLLKLTYYLLNIISIIIILLILFKIINFSTNTLCILLLLMIIIYTYINNKYHKEIYNQKERFIIKDLIGFDEKIL